MTTPIDHGTYSGYQKEIKRGIEPCPSCRAALANYMKTYRQNRVTIYDRHKSIEYARGRAMRRLAQLYPAVMQALYDEELREAGLQ